MATTAAAIAPPSLVPEENTCDMSPEEEEEEEDPEELPFDDDLESNSPPQSPQLETLPPQPVPSPPSLFNSLAELKDLSAAISSFQQCYDDLHNHLDSIKAAILSKLPPETPEIAALAPSSSSCRPNLLEETILQKQQQQEEQNPPNSELDNLCKIMCSRGIRKYMATHLPQLPKLREEVPKALKLALNPPKLVLECLGKFYLQGSKAFTKNSPMIPAREASILILECFLLMMGMDSDNHKDDGVMDIEEAVKGEAETAALAWRKRLLFEGGLAKANQIDARGLLLFVACFGIPSAFKKEDIRDLVIAGNAKEILGVLQKSHELMNKIPEIVEGMMKNKMEVDAIDIVYTFGLEARFNPHKVLMQFLRESKESWKKPRKGQGSEATQNDLNKKYLAALKSVSKCLERHKIDPTKLLSGWQIKEKIATLQREIAESEKKSADTTPNKRKAIENETWKRPKPQELPKRPRYVDHGQHHQSIPTAHLDSRRNLLDIGRPIHTNNYHASQAALYGGPGALSHGAILSTPSYAGVNGGMIVDTAGQIINHGTHHGGTHSYDWRADSALVEKYASQTSSLGLTSLYRASTSVEGFPGGVANATSAGHGNRAAQSDLYQFADAVAESESYRSGVTHSAAAPTALPSHYSSYLYQV
ncbi:hypothetical protein ABFS82_09G080300 [Erythranthe guttata]